MLMITMNPVGFAVASPWLAAAGVLLAGIPILIHLMRRQRSQTQMWGAMQFVRRAARRRSRRTRLEALLLLSIRTLIILFVAIALARPYVEVSGAAGNNDSGVQHVIIIDTSASMGHAGGDSSRFEQAIAEAGRIVDTARIGDGFNLLRIGGAETRAVIRRPAYEKTDVQREIAHLQLSNERGRPLEVLEDVPALLLEDSDISRREVYLLTDFQATNWTLETPENQQRWREVLREITSRARLSVIDVGAVDADNAAVTDVQGAVRLTASRMSAVVTATVRNYAQTRRPGQNVTLSINNENLESRTIDLPSDGEQTVSFDVPVSAVLDSVVEVRLTPDELPADDSRRLVLPPARDVRVLLVNGEPTPGASLPEACGFLSLALQPAAAMGSDSHTRPVILPTVMSDGMLADVKLNEFDCIYLCNVALLTEREVNLLEQFVSGGGGLVVVLGDAVRSANYNEMLNREERRLLPGRVLGVTGDLESTAGGFHFAVEDYSHPIVAPFEGNETAGLLTTRIDRYVQTEPDSDPAARVILRYTTGDGAILERRYGDGRVMLVTTALNDHWGNWALWPSFVPMMHELTRYASAGDFGRRERLVGERILRRIAAAQRDQADIVLESEDNGPQSVRVQNSKSGSEVESGPLWTPGHYVLRLGDDLESYVVNIDPAESDLGKLDEEVLAGLISPQSEFRYLQSWQPRSAEGASTGETIRNSLSTWFLVAACCLLLVEQLMAWRFLLGSAVLVLVVLATLVGQLTGSLLWSGVAAGASILALTLWRGVGAHVVARSPR